MKKILSAFLAVLMFAGVFSALFTQAVPVYAAESGETAEEENTPEDMDVDILKVVYKTPQDKLKDMKLRMENDNYRLYVRAAYGEIAVEDKRTGQVLFSNPYDIASTKGSSDTKAELMSQIIIEFMTGSKTTTYNSYTEAALREQIIVKNIKNGVRVEYTMGKSQTRWLVPYMITDERFQTMILEPMRENMESQRISESEKEFILGRFEKGFYVKKDINDTSVSKRVRDSWINDYPILKKIDCIWVLSEDTKDREFSKLESYIKMYAPEYTYEQLDYDHDLVEYEVQTTSQPLFRMAIEYTLDDTGLVQNLAANSIRFDETVYTLNYIQVNPWFGCGNGMYSGFTLIPDGSGTLTRFEDVKKPLTIMSKIYGSDYAYHTMDPAHRQTMRMPVYGVVENYYNRSMENVTVELPEDEWYYDNYGYLIKTKVERRPVVTEESRGYFAMLVEGDALAEISTVFGAGSTHVYSTVQTKFYPRPTDSYSVGSLSGTGADDMWTVSAKRKYTGNYKVKYFLLSDQKKVDDYLAGEGAEDTTSTFYTADYMGMVKACRSYLESTGELTRLTSEDLKEDIPLVIETLGCIDTDDTVLSIPVTVKKALTSFEDIKEMYKTLSDKGIKNVNFKLTGYANGGMYATVPNGLSWESAVGGSKGFKDLMEFANENDIGVFPEFEFSYVSTTKWFDGFSFKDHAAKTMDNRYPTKYYYDPAYQMIKREDTNPISSSVFSYFYNKFAPKLLEYSPTGISAGSLGSDLNSDFDKSDSYTREDSKSFVVDVLSQMKEDFGKVMVNGGNEYSLKYVDYIVEAPLDSSQYLKSSEAIPFMGMVLHGYVQFAGSALNMAGDIDYELLKTIENGSFPYFLLAYENTNVLKKDETYKKLYSVNFKIWVESGLVEKYNIMNEALKDVQDKLIIDHEFIKGVRVLTEAEKLERENDEKIREEASKAEETEEPAETVETVTEEVGEETEPVDAEEPAETNEAEAAEPEETEEPEAEKEEQPEEEQEEETAESTVNPEDIVDNGKIVKVTYENGKVFILNYNNYAVTVDGYDGEIAALGFAVYYSEEVGK